MQDYDAILGIYSTNNYLTDKLKEKFNSKYVDVVIFNSIEKLNNAEFNYLIINLIDFNFTDSAVERIISKFKSKIIILFPQYVQSNLLTESENYLDKLVKINPNIEIILVPELLGPNVKYSKNYISHDVIMQSVLSERIKIKNDGRLINTISVNKLCEKIVREIFSFGQTGRRLSLLGPRRVAKTFALKYLKLDSDKIIPVAGEYDFSEIRSDASIAVDFSLYLAVNNTKKSFLEIAKEVPEIKSVQKPKIVIKSKRYFPIKGIITVLIGLIAIYIIPLILIIISASLIFFASKQIVLNRDVAVKMTNSSSKISVFVGQFNLNNNFYYNFANILQKTSSLINETLVITKLSSELMKQITGDSLYDVNTYSNDISASLDKIHTDISFLQGDVSEFEGFAGIYLSKFLNKKDINISDMKSKIYSLKNLASRLSLLLGVEKPSKYLILFQNNMELRPTGGFIGSYAILTIDKGKMTEMNISDVYDADGQLKGHVDPPEPIRRYLGEGGWFMRDANWDPDFLGSAKKIEWFLDKEIGETVGGVIAIDLHFVQDLLRITGPINLVDFGKIITSQNLYKETQSEVEENFFPGSIKKASFMTALSRNLIENLEKLVADKYFLVIKEIYSNLEEKHIQIYLHDQNAEEAIDSLNYAGKINMDTDCSLRCFNDKYLLVDANLGVNKSNLFIERSHEMNSTISKDLINHELLVNYENTASVVVGKSAIYKSFTRLIVPKNSKILGAKVYNIDGTSSDIEFVEEIIGDRKETGFLIEVLPNVQKRVQIVWNIETNILQNGGEYNLSAYKQAGTDSDKLKVVLRTEGLSLTGKVRPVYNTDLSRDFNIKVFLKDD